MIKFKFSIDAGNVPEYTFEKGFCRHMIGQSDNGEDRAITVRLAQQTIINNLKILLWDKDDRNGFITIDTN